MMLSWFSKEEPNTVQKTSIDKSKINALQKELMKTRLFNKQHFALTAKLAALREQAARNKLEWVEHGTHCPVIARVKLSFDIAECEHEIEINKRNRFEHDKKSNEWKSKTHWAILVETLKERGLGKLVHETEEKALEAAVEYFNKYPEDKP